MPNNYLSVLYKHIIQVKNKNVGLKVCVVGYNHTIAPQSKTWGHMPPCPPPPYGPPPPHASYASAHTHTKQNKQT